ncbi:MAG TPA: sulfur carrier protein ThiS [Pirellulales bacterium]|nr:sulfur carrier protein ThiS [Pirellulales bacterium]
MNGAPRDVAAGVLLGRLLQELQLKTRHFAVEVNLQLVPREKHPDFALQPGDKIEIVSLVGGG